MRTEWGQLFQKVLTMPMDQNQERRRGHFHRGRRGPDRRGHRARQGPADQATAQSGRDHVDVEQIMRDIRARIAQRQRHRSVEPADPGARRAAAGGDSRSAWPQAGAARPAAPQRRWQWPRVDAAAPASQSIRSTTRRSTTRRRDCCGSSAGCSIRSSSCSSIRTRSRSARPAGAAERRGRSAKRNATAARPNGTRFTTKSCSAWSLEVSRVSLEVQSLALRIESLAREGRLQRPARAEHRRRASRACGRRSPASQSRLRRAASAEARRHHRRLAKRHPAKHRVAGVAAGADVADQA